MKKILLSAISLLLALSLTACTSENGLSSDGVADGDRIVYDEALYEAASYDADSDGGTDYYSDYSYDSEEAVGDAYSGSDDTMVNILPAAGTLTAGEWSDNDHWSFWQSLFQNEETGWSDYMKRWDQSYLSRTFVTVTFADEPVENAAVTVYDSGGTVLWQSKTDNEGKAYVFYSPEKLSGGNLALTAEYGDLTASAVITSENSTALTVELYSDNADAFSRPSKSLDLMLLVDTTGSMSDELSYLQEELESVINTVASENGNIPVRLSVNFYRDDGDEYVVRDFGFTSDISEAIEQLKAQDATGGGDEPEKVNAALDNAINEHQWNEDAVKLLFIILDAPPHSDDEQAVNDMAVLAAQASQKGIRVIPILASGGNKEAEYLMRDFAVKTGGTYLFLTDDSGVSAGQHIQPTVGSYEVEKLNDLMVKVVNRYLAASDTPAEYVDEEVKIIGSDSDQSEEFQQ